MKAYRQTRSILQTALVDNANGRVLYAAWNRARSSVGVDYSFHDLRHFGLRMAAATGASTRETMHRGGHSSPAAALRYQHATEDRDRVLSDALAELSGAATVTPIRQRRRS